MNHNNESGIAASATPSKNNKPWEETIDNPLPMTSLTPKSNTEINTLNLSLGRTMKVVNFRWLNETEL